MNIRLTGYFDKNFGDDIMQLLAVRGLPEHEIYIDGAQREMTEHLRNEPNVHIGTAPAGSAVLYVTGTGFQYGSRHAILSELIQRATGKRDRSHKAVIGCSMEPIRSRAERILINTALKKYDYISCRDRESYEYLNKNIKGAKINLSPDIAFALKGTHPEERGDCLGIAPLRKMYDDDNFGYYNKLARAADRFVGSTGHGVILYAFDNGLENDVSACCSIRSMMKRGDMTELVIYNSDPYAFLKQLEKSGRIVTSRFHGAVAALALNIPIFAVCNKEKLIRLCTEFGIGHEMRNADGAELYRFIDTEPEPVKLPSDIAERAMGHTEGAAQWLKQM